MNVTIPLPTPVQMNETSSGAGSAGLAVGLTLLFLLLGIVPGVIAYKRLGKRRKVQLGQDRSQKKDESSEAARDASHPYTSMYREQPAAQSPIYENFTRTAGDDRPAIDQSRSSREPDEDLYLQCDFADDAIYSNDPMCNLSVYPDSQEEDVYITPQS